MRKLKRKLAGIIIIMAAIFSVSMVVCTKSASYTYPNGHKMNYQLYSATASGASWAGDITKTLKAIPVL